MDPELLQACHFPVFPPVGGAVLLYRGLGKHFSFAGIIGVTEGTAV